MVNFEREEWRPVVGYEGLYEISNFGDVKSVERKVKRGSSYVTIREKLINGRVNRGGYRRVALLTNRKAKDFLVHRLVAMAFLPAPAQEGLLVRHINGDPSDNRAANLAWGTYLQNAHDCIRHGKRPKGEKHACAKIGRDEVREIIKRYSRGGVTQKQLGKEYGVHDTHICKIVSGKSWGWLTREDQYAGH